MLKNPRLLAAVALLLAVAAAAARHPEGEQHKVIEGKVNTTLKGVINQGAALYNAGDASGSYRLFQGALMAATPMLEHRPELVQKIDEGMAKAAAAPSCRHQAYILRKVLDDIRKTITTPPEQPMGGKELEGKKPGKDVAEKKTGKGLEEKKPGKTIEEKKDGKVIEEKKPGKTLEEKKGG